MLETRRIVAYLATLACTGVLIILSGCRTSLPDKGTPAPGTYSQTTPLHYRLSTRTYLVHVPLNYQEQRTWPLVMVLHGAFSTADEMERRSGFSNLADREGFVAVYPNGIGLLGFLQHWNAGYCCGLAEIDNVDDVGFLRYVIHDVSRKLRIDDHRVYLVGHSNGAMLAYRFACEDSEHVAGVAVVSGSLGSAKGHAQAVCKLGPMRTAVPLIAIHGQDDKTVPFAGGHGMNSNRNYVSAFDSVDTWARYCGCGSAPQRQEDSQAGEYVMTWRDNEGDTWGVLHALSNWRHAWPAASPARLLPWGRPLRAFDASETIWDFFCSYARPPATRNHVALSDAGR